MIFVLSLFFALPALAQTVMPSLDRTVNRSLPEDSALTKDTEFQRKYREIVRSEAEARAALQGALPSAPMEKDPPATTEPEATQTMLPQPADSVLPAERVLPVELAKPRHKVTAATGLSVSTSSPRAPATPVLVFAVSKDAALADKTTVLPIGSFVKARVVSGVEANTLEPYPVLLQLEYAFTGPNQSKIDLSNCFMIAKARANLSTERVIMETDTLSCVRANGEHFKSSARGYTAGSDSTFGSTGTFISKQGTVLLAAVLASIAKNAGEAVAMAQTTTTVAAGNAGAAQTASNVTGDQAKYIAGRSVVDGASLIAQWYLDYAKQLVPSIGIGSGESVHVVMLESIRVPTLQEVDI